MTKFTTNKKKKKKEKPEEPEIKLPISAGSSKKQERVPEKKKSISALLTMPKPSTVWITINCGKF